MLNYFSRREWLIILAVALGYYVDLFDVLLFSSIRTVSLRDIGIKDPGEITKQGLILLNIQLIGMMIGGIIWGIIADKLGRIKVLFLSILMYSIANLLNSTISTLEMYYVLRFIAGIGLAGELGAGITHIAESLPNHKRTYATNLVGFVGMLGAVTAGLMGTFNIPWRSSFIIGGILGIFIIAFRFGVNKESATFKSLELKSDIRRGNFLRLFKNKTLFFKYLGSVLVGIPVFYIVGILITLAPEFGEAFGTTETPKAATAIAIVYFLISIFDIVSGIISKKLKSRTKTMKIFIVFQFLATIIYLFLPTKSLLGFYLKCVPLGMSIGYWAVMIVNSAEIFGTNLRATVTTTVPNFIRGLLTPITIIFLPLKMHFGIVNAAAIIGLMVYVIAFTSASLLPEKFEQDLNYTE